MDALEGLTGILIWGKKYHANIGLDIIHKYLYVPAIGTNGYPDMSTVSVIEPLNEEHDDLQRNAQFTDSTELCDWFLGGGPPHLETPSVIAYPLMLAIQLYEEKNGNEYKKAVKMLILPFNQLYGWLKNDFYLERKRRYDIVIGTDLKNALNMSIYIDYGSNQQDWKIEITAEYEGKKLFGAIDRKTAVIDLSEYFTNRWMSAQID